MPSKLDLALQQGEPYELRVASEAAVGEAFATALADIERFLDTAPELWSSLCTAACSRETVRAQLTSGELVAAYISVIPCVEALIRTQLDHQRRADREARAVPLLGANFRTQLCAPATRAAFGPLLEAEIRAGYVGSAALSAGSARPVTLDAADVFDGLEGLARWGRPDPGVWTPRALPSCSRHWAINEMGRASGLLTARWPGRSQKREATLSACSRYCNSVGSALFSMTSSRRPQADPGGISGDRAGPRPGGGPREPLAAEAALALA